MLSYRREAETISLPNGMVYKSPGGDVVAVSKLNPSPLEIVDFVMEVLAVLPNGFADSPKSFLRTDPDGRFKVVICGVMD